MATPGKGAGAPAAGVSARVRRVDDQVLCITVPTPFAVGAVNVY
ncbi:hypothetical protein ThesuDRAFT_00354, partial [Thermaerobacter subterraneus DSM 13965]